MLQLTIEIHTKTIVIDGELPGDWESDCYDGLEDFGYWMPKSEDDDAPNKVNIDASCEDITTTLQGAIPRLVSLEGLEWYGRFAGDYYLLCHLPTNGVIKHVTFGVDMDLSGHSPGEFCSWYSLDED